MHILKSKIAQLLAMPKYLYNTFSGLVKTSTVILIAVWKTSVSQHHGDPIEGSPETTRTSQNYRIERFKGVLNRSLRMPRSRQISQTANESFRKKQNKQHLLKINTTRFGSRRFGRPTSRQTCTSEANHEDMDSLFPFLTKWEAHKIQLNFFLVQ